MGSEGMKTKHKAIMFPRLDKMWYTTKKLKTRYIDLPQWLKNGNENIKCKMFSYEWQMYANKSHTVKQENCDIQVSNKVYG